MKFRLFPALTCLAFVAHAPAVCAAPAPAVSSPPAKSAAPVVTAAQASSALTFWQSALDQLAQGRYAEARIMLETARTQSGDAPEINLLLAYLAEREGKDTATLLAPVQNSSALAAAWRTQIRVPETPVKDIQIERATTKPPVVVLPAILSQPDARLLALEKYVANRVNAERTARGLRPLSYDSLLADTARAHSGEMRDKKYFAHESPTPSLAAPLDRYRAAFGRTPRLVAENIYRSWGAPRRLTEKDAEEAHDALMKSPGHFANIVLPDATHIGIGLVSNSNGDFWITEMFAR
ncbi:MAG TPA: CAP domain-containing protein [Abditibacteriaceae bacterium]|jgi:uncharacterized protein YkwD